MKRQRFGRPSALRFYHRHLLHAIGKFLPHRGLPLLSGDRRTRWTDRLLVIAAMLLPWQAASTLKDAFESCWHVVSGMYPTRRRAGHSYEGFIKALAKHSGRLLSIVSSTLRQSVRSVAGRYWQIGGWVVMGVDGSRINCPRTVANEKAFGCAGRDKTAPQQLLTTVLHVGTGLPWCWRTGGGSDAERNHLRDMLSELPPASLLLADAGFTGYELLSRVIESGRSFIIRVGSSVQLLTKLGFAVREYDGIVHLWPHPHRDQKPLVLRLVVVHDGRKGVHLLTNVLEKRSLPDRHLATMYLRRWGIEVFYRSLKQTMEKRKMLSTSPAHARVELDWSMVGLWMLGLLAVRRMVLRQINPDRWSVAGSLRIVRRIMSGRCQRRDAKNLRALSAAVKDTYRRYGSKSARDWPHKKNESPPGAPKIRTATRWERLAVQRLKCKNTAA